MLCAMSVVIPSPDFTPGAIFTKTSGLKSHDWKEVYMGFSHEPSCEL